MLINENGIYRFSKEVENELSKIGVHITECICTAPRYQYCDDGQDIYVYSDQSYPSIQIIYSMNQYNPDLEEFTKKIEEIKNIAIKIHEIVMKDYQEEYQNDQVR